MKNKINEWRNPIIILVETSHSGNIGSVARAMCNMGLSDLRLVNPKCHYNDEQAMRRSSGAEHILSQATIFSDLKAATSDLECAVALSYRKRSLPLKSCSPRSFFNEYDPSIQCGFIFGNEQNGLSNHDLDYCHLQMAIPSSKAFPSLNLAASVQIITYEWAVASKAISDHALTQNEQLATNQAVNDLKAHCISTLSSLGVIRKEQPEHTIQRVNRLFSRQLWTEVEVSFLRGVLTAIDRKQ